MVTFLRLLNLTARFFNFGFSMLNTGNTVAKCALFGLQIIDKYLPIEATAQMNKESALYATAGHEWYMTTVEALFTKDDDR
jgi:hypothetical protein